MMAGPTLRRRQLGVELRRLRLARGVSRNVAAEQLGCSLTKITHLESGRNAPRKAELQVLLYLYGATAEQQTVLEKMREEASQRGWWSAARLPEWLAAYIGLEFDATSLRCVALELIPDLLQTEDYAREIHLLAEHVTEPDEVGRWVEAHMERQYRLTDPPPLELSAVVSEAALRRCAGHPTVARKQLEHLIKQAHLPNVELRVLPFSAGLHRSMSGPFSLLSFPDEALPDVVYQEYAMGSHIIELPTIVARFDMAYAALRDQALHADESLVAISELLAVTS
jgi:transcriptional regulator with XRE-family HTH domain